MLNWVARSVDQVAVAMFLCGNPASEDAAILRAVLLRDQQLFAAVDKSVGLLDLADERLMDPRKLYKRPPAVKFLTYFSALAFLSIFIVVDVFCHVYLFRNVLDGFDIWTVLLSFVMIILHVSGTFGVFLGIEAISTPILELLITLPRMDQARKCMRKAFLLSSVASSAVIALNCYLLYADYCRLIQAGRRGVFVVRMMLHITVFFHVAVSYPFFMTLPLLLPCILKSHLKTTNTSLWTRNERVDTNSCIIFPQVDVLEIASVRQHLNDIEWVTGKLRRVGSSMGCFIVNTNCKALCASLSLLLFLKQGNLDDSNNPMYAPKCLAILSMVILIVSYLIPHYLIRQCEQKVKTLQSKYITRLHLEKYSKGKEESFCRELDDDQVVKVQKYLSDYWLLNQFNFKSKMGIPLFEAKTWLPVLILPAALHVVFFSDRIIR